MCECAFGDMQALDGLVPVWFFYVKLNVHVMFVCIACLLVGECGELCG